ncbi:MAG: WG repeat-containing protein [Cytophagaceae bacterium]|nr:WG repeat-containing protein [Cytophagaceae bacterium]
MMNSYKLYFILFCCFFISTFSFAQILIPEKDSLTNLYGYKNLNTSEWQIKPEFESVEEFKKDRAIVSKNELFGIINKKGKFIVPLQFEVLEGEKFYFFTRGDTSGILNQKGDVLLKGGFSYVYYDPEKGSAILLQDELYGYWDTSGNYIAPLSKYELAFENDLAFFNSGKSQGFINKKGKKFIEIEGGAIWDIRPYGYVSRKENLECVYDTSGKKIGRCDYDSILQMRKEIILYKKNNKYGIMNYDGKELTWAEYDLISPFNEKGISIVKKNNLYGLINEKLEVVLPLENESIEEFGESYNRFYGSYQKYFKFSVFKLKEHYGVVNDSGTVVMKPDYDMAMIEGDYLFKFVHKDLFGLHDLRKLQKIKLNEMFKFVHDKTIFCIKGNSGTRCGIANKDGKILIMPVYNSITPTVNGYAIVKDNIGAGIMDSTTNLTVPIHYADILTLNDLYKSTNTSKLNFAWDGYIYLKTKTNKIGVAKESGKIVVDTIYHNIAAFDEDCKCWFAKDKNEDWKIINKAGKKLSVKLDTASVFDEGVAVVEKDGKAGVINETGKAVVPIKYDDIKKEENGLYFFKSDTLWGLMDVQGKKIAPAAFSIKTSFISGYAFVKDKQGWKIIDRTGKIGGYEMLKNIADSTNSRKINDAWITSFSYNDIKGIDEISFDLLAMYPDDKTLQIVNNYILRSKEELLKQDNNDQDLVVMLGEGINIPASKKFYWGLGMEILGVTKNTVTLNNYKEISINNQHKVNDNYKTYLIEGNSLRQITLAEIFSTGDYLVDINRITRKRAAEKKLILSKRINRDSLIIDPNKFIITNEGIIFKIDEKYPNAEDYYDVELKVRFREIKDIVRQKGILREFYE